MEMLGGMLANAAVAAAHVTALQANPQMHPLLADFKALFATFWGGWSDFPNLSEMGAFAHISLNHV
jgi:hypothetical protein